MITSANIPSAISKPPMKAKKKGKRIGGVEEGEGIMTDKKRNYEKEYQNYQGTPEQKKNRAKRNAARRKMEKAGKVSKNDGRDVDHIKGVKAGNGDSNLRVQSKSANRSYQRNKNAGIKKR